MSEKAKHVQLQITNALTVINQKAEELYALAAQGELYWQPKPQPTTLTTRDLMKKLEQQTEQLEKKDAEIALLRDRAKLKDRSKMKVERDRDAYKAWNARSVDKIRDLEKKL